MDDKQCCTCKISKSEDSFSKCARMSDGLQPRCKQCAAAYFAANRDKVLPLIHARKKQLSKEKREIIWNHLQEHPCVDCGETDPLVLDFDHVRGEKRGNVSSMVTDNRPVRFFLEEIDKCEIRCSNCHRRKTARDRGWFKLFKQIDSIT